MQEKINTLKKNIVALPFNKKVILGGALAISLAATSFTVHQLNQPNYIIMMNNLDATSLQTIIPVFEAEGIPFSIAPNNSTLLVDRDSVQKATTILAKNGLPAQPTSGYDHLKNSNSPYITKSTEEQVSRQILEENLESSIMQLELIEKAEVRLAVSKNSQFLRDVEPATASIVLTLKKGTSLNRSQISGIVKMVAYSVPNLPEENVIIIDNTGRSLSKGVDGGFGGNGTLNETKLLIEEQLKQKVIEVIAPLVGLDSVRVNIEAVVNFDKIENTKEEPVTSSVILSQQTEKSFDPDLASAGGAVGSVANQPPKHASFDESPKENKQSDKDAGISHIKETTNYSVGKSITHTIKSTGNIQRVNIAILFDATKFTPQELPAITETIKLLTQSSIGFDESRGDLIEVRTATFEKPEVITEKIIPMYETKIAKDAIAAGKWIGAIFLLWLMFWRPLLNKLSVRNESTQTTEDAKSKQDSKGELNFNQFNEEDITESTEVEFSNEIDKAIKILNSKSIESQNVFQSWLADLSINDLLNQDTNTDTPNNELDQNNTDELQVQENDK